VVNALSGEKVYDFRGSVVGDNQVICLMREIMSELLYALDEWDVSLYFESVLSNRGFIVVAK
jgi:hypothetical protein